MPSLLLALALLLGEEHLLTAPVRGPSAYNSHPAIAASSANTLAAWFVSPPQTYPRGRIAVMPLGEDDAQAQDPILLDEAAGAPGVASNGDDYLVAWCVDGAITTRRLAKDGTPLEDAQTIAPSSSLGGKPFGSSRTSVVWDGTHYVVAAQGGAIEEGTLVKRFVAVAIAGTDRRMTFDEEDLEGVAAIPGVTLVVSFNYRPIFGFIGRFITADGAVSAPFRITPPDGGSFRAVAGDGSLFWITSVDGRNGLRVARMALNGAIFSPVTIAPGVMNPDVVSVWNGRELDVAFSTVSGGTKIARVPNFGLAQVLDAGPYASELAITGANGVSVLAMSNSSITARFIRGDEIRAIDLARCGVRSPVPARK